MSSLLNIYFKKDQLEKMLADCGSEKGLSITASINDETNQYDQNISVFKSQTKDERDRKDAKKYYGNGSVVWTDGKIVRAENKEQQSAHSPKPENTNIFGNDDDDDLPF